MLSIATEQQKTLVEYRSEITRDRGGLCWLDLQQPTDQELQTAAQLCGAPIALLEAAADTETTIRSDMEDGWLMLVSRAIRAADKKLDIQHLGLVVKENWLVTLHEAELPETAEVSREWQVEPTTGAAHLLYYLLDALLDGLFPMLDEIEDKLYETEENIIGNRLQSIVLEQILRNSSVLVIKSDFLALHHRAKGTPHPPLPRAGGRNRLGVSLRYYVWDGIMPSAIAAGRGDPALQQKRHLLSYAGG